MHIVNITIIGAGNMGASLARGLIATHYPAEKICMTDADTEKLQKLQQQLKINTDTNNLKAIENADVVILAVKPQILSQVTKELAAVINKKKPLVLSIAAGIKIASLEAILSNNIPIVRCMPNTPALIGCGATALFANESVTPEQHDLAESILRAVSVVVWLDEENKMDAVTALSGSGPAYFFLMMDALQTAGEKLGLPKDTARLLTLQTAFGAAKMALDSPQSLQELRLGVTSKGGTTEQAVHVLMEGKIEELFLDALTAAKNRSEEIAEEYKT